MNAKDNYFEKISWIEDVIESCETLEQENKAREIVDNFERKLLSDNSVKPDMFESIVKRINDKINNQYKLLIQDY